MARAACSHLPCRWVSRRCRIGQTRPTRTGYFTDLPAITVPFLTVPEFAVASTFGFSFFGFLASLLPRFFSLDIAYPFH